MIWTVVIQSLTILSRLVRLINHQRQTKQVENYNQLYARKEINVIASLNLHKNPTFNSLFGVLKYDVAFAPASI